MAKRLIGLGFLMCLWFSVQGQHTFSIVAVDPLTGEVGSAGASCVSGFSVSIIAYVLPGVGAMNTQAWWQSGNKNRGAQLMLSGHTPQQIIDSLSTDDRGTDGRDQRWRQYGAVILNGGSPLAAGWTGDSADDWKGHIVGPHYAIQGNILLGPQILDSMESRFLNTTGDLATRLMAALQGANVPGADTRCLSAGTSSTGAYIQVAKPSDLPGAFSLNLNVPPLASGREPIDSLQVLFNAWQQATDLLPAQVSVPWILYPTQTTGNLVLASKETVQGVWEIRCYDLSGICQLHIISQGASRLDLDISALPAGMYGIEVLGEHGERQFFKVLRI